MVYVGIIVDPNRPVTCGIGNGEERKWWNERAQSHIWPSGSNSHSPTAPDSLARFIQHVFGVLAVFFDLRLLYLPHLCWINQSGMRQLKPLSAQLQRELSVYLSGHHADRSIKFFRGYVASTSAISLHET